MSLSGAMTIAVSALKAQAQAITVISDNLANSSTTAYKSTNTSFKSLVTQSNTTTAYGGAGVTTSIRQNVSAQGTITATSNSTDLALDGDGMFVVSYGGDEDSVYFTRNGEFDLDEEGYLVNGSYYLMGWPTDENGNLTVTESTSTLERINITDTQSTVAATTEVSIDADLGPNSTAGDDYTTSFEVYDSLGNLHTVNATWEKTATNEWSVSFASDDGTTATAATTLTFDGDGELISPDPAEIALDFAWSNGSYDSAITVDLSSLSQTYSSAGISQSSVSADGHASGKLTGITIADDGTVTASYDNGASIAIYKIAVATFPNYDGLQTLSNGVYQTTAASGDYTLHVAGEGGSATLSASALESSTVDTADEFTRMIVAQQAYSAASQVISTAKDMYDELISAVR